MEDIQTIILLREEVICFFILLYLFFNNLIYRTGNESSNFLWLCSFAIGHVVFDGVTVYTVNHLDAVPEFINKSSHILFYLFGTLFGAEFLRYVTGMIYPKTKADDIRTRIKCGYGVFSVLYFLVFWFIPIQYTKGVGTNYSDGPAAIAAFLIPMVFFTVTTVLIVTKRKMLSPHVTAALLPMIAVVFIAEILEILQTEILITGGCITLVTVGVYFSLENPILLSALRQAKAADYAKSMFLASMSHEIRTPLNAVIGFAEVLKNKNIPEGQKQDYIKSISDSGNALLALINDVLDISKLEAGHMEFRQERMNFRTITDEISSIFKQKCAEKDLTLSTILNDDFPDVWIDALRIRQILFNLVGNAVKFTKQGGISITIRFEPEDSGKGTLSFSVADTGIGIPQEDQKGIFDMFVQAKVLYGTELAKSGTGLGLALCQRLVRKMNGSLTLSSEPGKGSVFTVRLPHISYAEKSDSACFSEKQNDSGETVPKCRGKNVLLVDDVPMNLKVLCAMLERLQVRIHTAENGDEALKILLEHPVQFVLTDLWMPGMNGVELAEKIRSLNPSVRIAVLTADVDAHNKFEASLFDAVLTKPVTLNKLKTFLKT